MTRRQRILQLRKRVAFLIFTLLLIVIISIGCFSLSAKAHDNSPELHKYYKSVQVTYGSTLYTMALEYNEESKSSIEDYISEVMHINHLKDDTIYSGQYIVVPYYSYEINI